MGLSEIFYNVSVLVLPVLLAITLHEAAHGFVAWQLGDDTAKRLGRVSFNPLRHIDIQERNMDPMPHTARPGGVHRNRGHASPAIERRLAHRDGLHVYETHGADLAADPAAAKKDGALGQRVAGATDPPTGDEPCRAQDEER